MDWGQHDRGSAREVVRVRAAPNEPSHAVHATVDGGAGRLRGRCGRRNSGFPSRGRRPMSLETWSGRPALLSFKQAGWSRPRPSRKSDIFRRRSSGSPQASRASHDRTPRTRATAASRFPLAPDRPCADHDFIAAAESRRNNGAQSRGYRRSASVERGDPDRQGPANPSARQRSLRRGDAKA